MLDKNTINFLKYLNKLEQISMNDYFDYCQNHKLSKMTTVRMYCYLLDKNYFFIKSQKIYPTYQTTMLLNNLHDSKLENFFTNHLLPYIQQIVIFILGLLAPYLLKCLEQITKILEIL